MISEGGEEILLDGEYSSRYSSHSRSYLRNSRLVMMEPLINANTFVDRLVV